MVCITSSHLQRPDNSSSNTPTNLCSPKMSAKAPTLPEHPPPPASETSAQQAESCLQLYCYLISCGRSIFPLCNFLSFSFSTVRPFCCLLISTKRQSSSEGGHTAHKIYMGCRRSIFCRSHLWLDHTMMLTHCQPSSRLSGMGLTRINNSGRTKERERKERRKQKKKEKNGIVFANKQTIKVSLNFSFLCSSDGSVFQMERGTVTIKTFLILFPNWHDEHPGFEVVARGFGWFGFF